MKHIITENSESWKSALSNVKGVYLITDRNTGKLYVGSAYGKDAFWSRWKDYAERGHGGNAGLKILLNREGVEYAENLSFSVLEIFKINTDDDYIISRESFGKIF